MFSNIINLEVLLMNLMVLVLVRIRTSASMISRDLIKKFSCLSKSKRMEMNAFVLFFQKLWDWQSSDNEYSSLYYFFIGSLIEFHRLFHKAFENFSLVQIKRFLAWNLMKKKQEMKMY